MCGEGLGGEEGVARDWVGLVTVWAYGGPTASHAAQLPVPGAWPPTVEGGEKGSAQPSPQRKSGVPWGFP